MKKKCHVIRELLEDGLSRDLKTGDQRTVERHVNDCAGCRRHRDGLRSDDRRLGALAASVGGLASRIEDGVLGSSSGSVKPDGKPAPRWFQHPAVRVAAAVVVIVAIAVVSNLTRRTAPTDVIWANVFRQIEQSNAWTARGELEQNGERYEFAVYESTELGSRIDTFRDGELLGQVFWDFGRGTTTIVSYEDSTYHRQEFNPAVMNISSIYDTVERMKGRDHKSLGLSEIDGLSASGIEVVDTISYGDSQHIQILRMYVDIDTQRPVRLVADRVSGGAASDVDLVMYEFDWYPSFERSNFDAVIPEGFRPVHPTGEPGN